MTTSCAAIFDSSSAMSAELGAGEEGDSAAASLAPPPSMAAGVRSVSTDSIHMAPELVPAVRLPALQRRQAPLQPADPRAVVDAPQHNDRAGIGRLERR